VGHVYLCDSDLRLAHRVVASSIGLVLGSFSAATFVIRGFCLRYRGG